MKIALNMGQDSAGSDKESKERALEQEILAAKKGDWTAKNNLYRTYTSLIASLAEKRAKDQSQINDYMEAGKQGLFRAAKKYKTSVGPKRFQIFALDYIEQSMDGGGGLLSRLFGGK